MQLEIGVVRLGLGMGMRMDINQKPKRSSVLWMGMAMDLGY